MIGGVVWQVFVGGGASLSLSAQEDTVVEIEAADSLLFATLGELKESVVQLAGGVQLSFVEDKVRHSIKADTITINRDAQLIVAQGNIEYTVQQGASSQTFYAQSLVFETNNLTGLLIEVRSHSTVGASGEVFYSATQITKSAGDVITADGFMIGSAEGKEAYWRLKAQAMWALTEDEWVFKNMALYVGHVPMFYLPYYYHSRNTIFFNPVFGFSSWSGFFMNTTTTLWGQPTNTTSPFNLGVTSAQKESEGHVALMLDYYGRTGVMMGLTGEFDTAKLRFNAGVAHTRVVFNDMTVVNRDGQQEVAGGYFWGYPTPVRFGFDLTGQHQNLTFAVDIASDPLFKNEFFTHRKSGPDWLGFLSFTGNSTDFSLTPAASTSFIRYHDRFTLDYTWLNEVSINYANVEMVLQSQWNSQSRSQFDPNRYFYGMQVINAPNVEVGFKTRVPLLSSKPKAPEVSEASAPEALPRESVFEGSIFTPQLITATQKEAKERHWGLDFYYDATVSERAFAEPGGMRASTPEADRLNPLVWQNLAAGKLDLGLEAKSTDETLRVRWGMVNQGSYHTFFNGVDATPSQQAQSNRLQQAQLHTIAQLEYRPFLDMPYWSKSLVRYSMDYNYFSNTFNATTGQRQTDWLKGFSGQNADLVARYDTGAYAGYGQASGVYQQNTWTGETRVGGTVDYYGVGVNGYVYANKQLQKANGFGFGFDLSYQPFDKLKFYSQTQYDFERAWSLSEAGVQVYGLKTGFVWQERDLVQWNPSSYSWDAVVDGSGKQVNDFVPSYLFSRLNQNIPLYQSPKTQHKDKTVWDVQLVLLGELKLDWLEYTQSFLTFGLGVDVLVNERLKLHFATLSRNDAMHIYLPFMYKNLGVAKGRNFFTDLGQSFAFWNTGLRQDSLFKWGSLEVSLDWDLPEWALHIGYSGRPEAQRGATQVTWRQQLDIWVKWKVLTPIKSSTRLNSDNQWQVGP